MKGGVMKKKHDPTKLTAKQKVQLQALRGRTPDTHDIPEAPARNWRYAHRGPGFRPDLYRARKSAISLRVDIDVLQWLRARGPGYQSRINEILRREMEIQLERISSKRPRR